MRYRHLLRLAEQEGASNGAEMAAWYFDRTEPERSDYLKVLKGIREGDPEIMDTFPSGHLSGEFADDMTPKRLYEELGASERQIESGGDELCTAYEQAFDRAYSDTVEQNCREMIRRTVTFVIDAEVEEQDINVMLANMCEVVGKANADLVEDKIMDEIGGRIEA
jgi:hypothetical protein